MEFLQLSYLILLYSYWEEIVQWYNYVQGTGIIHAWTCSIKSHFQQMYVITYTRTMLQHVTANKINGRSEFSHSKAVSQENLVHLLMQIILPRVIIIVTLDMLSESSICSVATHDLLTVSAATIPEPVKNNAWTTAILTRNSMSVSYNYVFISSVVLEYKFVSPVVEVYMYRDTTVCIVANCPGISGTVLDCTTARASPRTYSRV